MRVGGARAPLDLMKRKRHTGEEIIKKLREAGGMLAAGRNVEEVCRALGVSAATYQRWISHCGGIKKNARLKRAVADLILHMLDRFTFAGRAYHFPSAISLSIALSKVRSATARLSRAFSFSNSRSLLSASFLMPP